MSGFAHERHKPPTPLGHPRELVLACAPLRSNVNLSRIVRAAGCCGVRTVICCGAPKLIDKIVRDSADGEVNPAAVEVRVHRTLAPPLAKLKQEGYRLVGLEQTAASVCLYDFAFVPRTVLVLGNERRGIEPEILAMLHDIVEIPVYGLPYSHNVATAAAMALYEYCRQFPK